MVIKFLNGRYICAADLMFCGLNLCFEDIERDGKDQNIVSMAV